MYIARYFGVILFLLLLSQIVFPQQLKLGKFPYDVEKSAVLELKSDNQGLLLPRIADTALINTLSPPDGMIIFFTPANQLLLRVNGHWEALGLASSLNNYWSVNGNSNGALKQFGNIDDYSLPFITNNTERMRIDNLGNIGIGTSSFDATNPEKLLIDAGTTSSYNLFAAKGTINNYLQLNIQNRSNGNSASSDIVATADNGTESLNYIDMGINSSGYANVALPVLNGVNNAYLYSTGNDFIIGNGIASKNLRFFTGGYATTNERLRIDGNGRVGVGVTAPTAILHLKAGTASANTAPLKFTSGALLTTAAAGAVEFLTDKFYGTIATGAARKEFTLNDIGLTAGRVPFSTTNGRLTDLAGFTYTTNRLSPTYLTLGAGTATAGTAPLVMTAGTNLTTPFAGAIEFDGTHFYGTVGSTRYQFDQQTGTTYTGSNGITLSGNDFRNNLITGIAGDQTVTGGTAAGNSLTLSSTNHATKGNIVFGTSVYDEVNNRFGIGNSTPSEAMDVTGNLKFSGALMPNNNAGTSGYLLRSNGAGTSPSWINLALSNLSDAAITSPAGGQILQYNGANWINYTPTYLTTIDTSNISNFYQKVRGLFSGTAPITFNAAGQIGITQATTSTNGYLSNTDWNTFNSKGSGNGTVTSASVVTANGVSGTVATATTTPAITLTLGAITPTSVAATGTVTGSNLSGTNTGNVTIGTANGLSLAGQALSQALASTSVTGALSNTDWNTFNNKLSSVDTTSIANFSLKVRSLFSGTAPITYTAGVIGISQATTSTNGYVSSTDWNTFNNKVGSTRTISTTAPLQGGGDLSANRTLSITDAAADALTKGAATFTAADFNAATGLISIDYTNGQAASGSTKGFLTSADWNTFNNKVGASNVWSVTGNSGINPATNFIGTTDNKSMRFRTNNIERIYIDSATGYVGLGTSNTAGGFNLVTDGTDEGNNYWFDDYTNAVTRQSFQIRKARGTVSSPINLVNGDLIGALRMNGYNNGGFTTHGGSGMDIYYKGSGMNDLSDLRLMTNNTERIRVDEFGSVGIGTSTFNATYPEKLLVDAGTTSSFNLISGKGTIDNYLQLNIQNLSSGTAASADVVATNNTGTETTNFIDMGINSSLYSNTGILGGANNAYLYSAGSDLIIGNATAGEPLRFFTGGTATTNERMRIDGSGNVGIGTTSSAFPLAVEKNGGTVASFNRTTSDGTIISLRQAGTEEGTISIAGTTVSYNAFTGSHYAWTNETIEKGMLVTLTGNNQFLHDNKNSEIIYGIRKCAQPNDPKIMGAYLGLQESSATYSVSNPNLVMAVGNGVMWVVDKGENIEIGDYLISSDVEGHAMKDNGFYPTTYVIARVAESVNWAIQTETVNGVKHKLLSVFFESFVRNNAQKELEDIKKEMKEMRERIKQLENKNASGKE